MLTGLKPTFLGNLDSRLIEGEFYNSYTFFYSYLKRHKQNVKTNNTHCTFQLLVIVVLKRSMLSSTLFNIFINELFYWVKEFNFAGGNTVLSAKFSAETLLETLEIESQIATEWFKDNSITLNAGKFQAIIVKQNSYISKQYILHIDGNQVTSEKSVNLLGTNIDNKLSFDEHVKKQST